MKKLLGAALVFVMSLMCAFALVACSDKGNADAETATKAINSVKLLYADKAAETPSDYTVIGQAKVDDTVCPITWTISSEVSNISDYVTVSEMDATTKLVTVSITKADEAMDYTLTASVTVGKATESVNFERKVPAKPKDATGTKDDPYSASKVIEIANTLEDNGYFGGNDEPTRVYVKGYIVDCGTDSPANNRVGYVYIVDEYSEDKTSKSPDALLILSINYDDTNLTGYADLEKGNEIMVSGYIMKYVKSGSTTAQPEITYKGSNGIACEYLQKAERTDAEKVTLAKDALQISKKSFNETAEVTLPTSNISGVTITWTSSNTELVTIADGVMTIVSVPATETQVTLTASINCGEVTEDKEFTLTIVQPEINKNALVVTSEALELPSAYANGGTATISGIAFAWIGMADYGDGMQMRTSDKTGTSSFYNTAALPSNITKLELVWSDTKDVSTKADVLKVELANNADFTDAHEVLVTFTGSKFELDVTGEYTYVRITHNNNGAVYLNSVNIVCAEEIQVPDTDGTTATVTLADYATANNWENSQLYESITIDSNITVAVSAENPSSYGQNSGKYYTSGSNWRVYQNETPSITFTAAEGYKISTIKVTYTNANNGVIVVGETQYESGAVITADASSFVLNVGNTGTATNGQVRITAIEVVYIAE